MMKLELERWDCCVDLNMARDVDTPIRRFFG